MAVGDDTNLHTRFHGGAFYLRAGASLFRLRGTAQPAALVTTGQSYLPGGTGATIRLLGVDSPQVVPPAGYRTCPAFEPLVLRTTYFAAGNERDLVVRVDDLTGALTPVIAETDAYAGSTVTRVRLIAQGDCGDLAFQLSLADGRELLVRRAAGTGMLKTLLRVAPDGGVGGGEPIAGAAGRHYGFVRGVLLEDGHTLVEMSIDSDAPARLGGMLARIDDTTGAVTCAATDTDVPCQLTAPAGTAWSHGGDTAATVAGQIVRGGAVQPAVGASSGVAVCRTGDVFFLRAIENFQEIVAVRRDNRSERVTRFRELALSGEQTARYIQTFFVGPGCELVVDGGDPNNNSFGRWIHWPDGTLGKIAADYRVAGFDANGDVGIRTYAGAHAIARRPAGCVVPLPQ